jgi:hypothetical protein
MTPADWKLLAALSMSDIAPSFESERQNLDSLREASLAAWVQGPVPPGGGPPIMVCRITLSGQLMIEDRKHPKS